MVIKFITSNIRLKNKTLIESLRNFFTTSKGNKLHQNGNRNKGKYGENIAAKYLKTHGYKIVERNYYCKFGEIDVIALNEDMLVFIEIKTRSSRKTIPPEFTVTKPKQNKIKKTARHYIGKHNILNRDCRFDIVAITMEKGKHTVILYKNAFD